MNDERTPLPVYHGHEVFDGRLRTFTSLDYFLIAFDRAGHDPGDEDRRCTVSHLPPRL